MTQRASLPILLSSKRRLQTLFGHLGMSRTSDATGWMARGEDAKPVTLSTVTNHVLKRGSIDTKANGCAYILERVERAGHCYPYPLG